jgi:hypothetical protein
MLCVGFEPMIPASERAETVHVLDRSATVTGLQPQYNVLIISRMLLRAWAIETKKQYVTFVEVLESGYF